MARCDRHWPSAGRALLAAGMVTVWSGCAAVPRPIPATANADAASVFALVRAREEAIVSLRTSFSARTRERDRTRSVDGVLLVQKPDRFRLRMMLPLGVTVFDYLTVGERTQIAFPLEGRIVNGVPQGDWATFSRDDLSQAFLRGARAFPGTCTPVAQDAELVVVTCHERDRLQRRFLIERRTATVREEISYDGDRPRLVMRFGEYRMIGSTPMPSRVELQYPERAMVVEITVRTTEVNPTLEASLFQPLAQWDAHGSRE
jgi:hypothetical protein